MPNLTESRFALNPSDIDISRSKFNRDSSVHTSFSVGSLVPFFVDEVLPGDSFEIKTHKVLRMPALLNPVMDDLYLDTYYFFVPNRIVWDHWKNLQGENTSSAWYPDVEYAVPQVTAPSGGWQIGSIADYMGIPTGISGLKVSALPFRAYAMIVNEWFRDQNLQNPVHIVTDDIDITGSNGTNYITDLNKGGMPFVANKYHDYFTSCLPSPQKGPDVTLTVSAGGNLPVVPGDAHVNYNMFGATGNKMLTAVAVDKSTGDRVNASLSGNGMTALGFASGSDSGTPKLSSMAANNTLYNNYATVAIPDNLIAINSGEVSVATINQLRTAFQVQKMLEKDARAGTRYREVLKSHFGVTSPDARQQVPEYLGGNRINLNVNQVVQTSSTTNESPMANVAGYSLTSDSHADFVKSFTEHGFIIGVMCARYHHTYQQGLNRMWSRKKRTDFYMPVFANIGEQAVTNKEIYAQGPTVLHDTVPFDDEVFGYQEAWADYRYRPDICTGHMRSASSISLDNWHFADDYNALPHLSSSWIHEDKSNVDRCLAVTSENTHQIFGDILIENDTTRPMPVYSIPGLIDHH